MASRLFRRLYVLYGLLSAVCSYELNNDITFSIPQAQQIWQNEQVLGSSTKFNHPLSMGTVNACEKEVMSWVFDSNLTLHPNYTEWNPLWGVDRTAVNLYQRGYSFQYQIPDLKIESDIVSLEACFMACITTKEFVCREFDYYKTDSGVCALHMRNGVYGNTKDRLYVGTNPSSDHYKLFPGSKQPPPCNKTMDDYAHSYFALGWKAMEAGWYELARHQFNEALMRDEEYYIAFIGQSLSNEDFGYGLTDPMSLRSYKDILNDISLQPDLSFKLTFQQKLLLNSLVELHNGINLQDGLERMIDVFLADDKTEIDYAIRIVNGNALLLKTELFQPLESHSKNNVFALQYLTHNLNPYGNGKNRTSYVLRDAAVRSVHQYNDLGVNGAARITSDCIDITLYYAEWLLGRQMVDNMRDYLFRNVGAEPYLFREENGNLITNGLNVTYMSQAWRRYAEYEVRHFFSLQIAQFINAQMYLDARKSEAQTNDDEQRKNLRLRMAANAYFSTYDYIYDKYAQEMVFDKDWMTPLGGSTSDLAVASRAYYWTAAAVQMIRKEKAEELPTILSVLDSAVMRLTRASYKTLVALYKNVVKATQEFHNKKYSDALNVAKQAAALQTELINADWTITGNEESKYFRMLIPLGYQFQADMMRFLYLDDAAKQVLAADLTNNDVIEAYKLAIEAPPQNTSRLMKGYGDRLLESYGSTPKSKGEDTPIHIEVYSQLLETWKATDAPAEEFNVKDEIYNDVEYYYDRPITDCQAELFQIRSEKELCWGGYVIIGISLAVIVIIAIVIGILCLRNKAASPSVDKEKTEAFIFSGPDLSQRGDNSPYSSETPFTSQTLDIRRTAAYGSNSNIDSGYYGGRSHTLGAGGRLRF